MLRGKMFRRITAVILAALIAAPCTVPAFAEKTDAEEEGRKPALTLKKQAENKDKNMEDSVVVMFNDDSRISKKEAGAALRNGAGAIDDIKVREIWNFRKDEKKEYTSVALVSSGSLSAGKLVKKLKQRKDVKYAEKNHRIHALSVTNDTYSDYQWSMQDGENAPGISTEWAKGITGSDEKIVAVVDTGVDYTHPDLKDNIWHNTHKDSELKGTCGFDFIDGDRDPMDENGHGTHCAGIIGAMGNNEEGISGVNQKIRIMALRILDAEGSAYLAHEIAAYNYINDALDLGEPVAAINNSWGGGEESQIMADLVDIVGEKGAVTVCAAGNDGENNDYIDDYPSGIDSPYLVSVAATGSDGELTGFSNYGETVDVAAPGADILSSVSYDCYNPTLYDDAKQAEVSESYNGYESDDDFAMPSADDIKIDGKRYGDLTEEEKGSIEISAGKADGGYMDESGRSYRIEMKNLPADTIASFSVPYELHEGYTSLPELSIVGKPEGPEGSSDMFGGPIFGIVDADEDVVENAAALNEVDNLEGTYIEGTRNFWSHIEAKSHLGDDGEPEVGRKRKFIVLVYSYDGGDFALTLDDIGLSDQDTETSDFGKYDFYNGTSMATPYITGTFALKAAEYAELNKDLPEDEQKDTLDMISEVVSSVNDSHDLPVGSRGSIDFRNTPSELGPRVGSITVDTEADTIRIDGAGFEPSDGNVKVEIGPSESDLEEAEIIDRGKKYLIVKNEHWINNIETVKVTGFSGKTSVRRNVYLVRGKLGYEMRSDAYLEFTGEPMATDGKKIYCLDSSSRLISASNCSGSSIETDDFAEIDCDAIFGLEKDKNKQYGMLFRGGLAYANGYLYTVVEYGAADQKEDSGDDDDWLFSSGRSGARKDDDDDDDEEEGGSEIYGNISIYSGQCRLIRVSTSSGEVTDLGEFPEEAAELESTDDYTIGAYNGQLYFIGGHSYNGGDQGLTDKVFIYDPKSGKWSEGAPLAEKRAGGTAVQSGNQLFYVLGSSEDNEDAAEIPEPLVFDGSSWTEMETGRLTKLYELDVPSVSIIKGGLLFTGAPVMDYGDTFVLDAETGKYADTGYNFVSDPEDPSISALAVGDTLYGVSEERTYTVPVDCGFIKITGKKKGKGKISGTGYIAPGNDAKITVKASKKNHIKSIKAGSKKIKLKKNASRKVVTIKKPLKDLKVTVVFAKNKKKRK